MTPKEKAIDLLQSMHEQFYMVEYGETIVPAKECCRIMIKQLIKSTNSVDTQPPNNQKLNEYRSEYWKEVLKELELFGE